MEAMSNQHGFNLDVLVSVLKTALWRSYVLKKYKVVLLLTKQNFEISKII